MTEFSMTPANEEAHWTSFRGAIADLQLKLSNINNSNYASIYRHDPSSHPQDISAFRCGGSAILIDDNNNAKSQLHLELIGLEEVNTNSQCENEHELHAQSSTHSSHATMDALSITTRQLSETKLKLALIESERDELEFQLMQKR